VGSEASVELAKKIAMVIRDNPLPLIQGGDDLTIDERTKMTWLTAALLAFALNSGIAYAGDSSPRWQPSWISHTWNYHFDTKRGVGNWSLDRQDQSCCTKPHNYDHNGKSGRTKRK
jgi:hypothetical protein